MHYKNGREAKNGDKVIWLGVYGGPVSGILYDAVAGNNSCNGRLAARTANDPTPNLAECLHADDVKNGNFPSPAETPPAAATPSAT